MKLLLGDCLEVLSTLPADSVDSVVTDPPYHLTADKKGGSGVASLNLDSPAGRARISTGFMGKAWDGGDIAFRSEFWAEVLRVLKPGAHLLAFGGTRTHHRMVCAIEDAGFEIRDEIDWVYGSGFPKSLDISKALDAAAGAEREVVGIDEHRARQQTPKNSTNALGDFAGSGGIITAPATDLARQWSGWGTALKPAKEPICLARKPLIGTVVANVTRYGTGGINIGGCRVAIDPKADASQLRTMNRNQRTEDLNGQVWGLSKNAGDQPTVVSAEGRWPANLIHDGSEEVLAAFPDAVGQIAASIEDGEDQNNTVYGAMKRGGPHHVPRNEANKSAARFFYSPKCSRKDREEGCEDLPITAAADMVDREPDSAGMNSPRAGAGRTSGRRNSHPTVKPTELMRYLCRLVTPPGGIVLDPFMGSGSTGKAALLEGFDFIGIEKEVEYLQIAKARIGALLV